MSVWFAIVITLFIQDTTHLVLKGVKIQVKDQTTDNVLSDKQYHFAGESECSLWMQAFQHAMTSPAPVVAKLATSPLSSGSNALRNSSQARNSPTPPTLQQSRIVTIPIFDVIFAAVELAWESLAGPVAILTQ